MFNIGDTVRIKENANNITVRGIIFNNAMTEFCGQEHEIIDGLDNRWILKDVYRMKCADDYWIWANDWLEPVAQISIKEITDLDFDKLFG